MTFLDGTSIGAHHEAAGAAKKASLRRIGSDARRSLAPTGVTARKSASSRRAGVTRLRSGSPPARPLNFPMPSLCSMPSPARPSGLSATGALAVAPYGARPAIPPRRNEEPVARHSWIYSNRNRVERL